MKQLKVHLTSKQAAKISKLAQQDDASLSAVARRLIDRAIEALDDVDTSRASSIAESSDELTQVAIRICSINQAMIAQLIKAAGAAGSDPDVYRNQIQKGAKTIVHNAVNFVRDNNE